jgi:hypothetical protein
MNDDSDFGYSRIEWEQTSAENVKLVEAEYRLNFDGTLTDAQDLDKKAQFVLTGLLGLTTAVLSFAFSQSKDLELRYLVGLYVLASTLGLGAVFACLSLLPRTYSRAGTTPNNLDVSHWKPLLQGDEKDVRRLYGVRIRSYARAIKAHTAVNGRKSRWLKYALSTAVVSVFATLASAAVTPAVLVFLNLTKAAVVAPVLAP